MRRRPVTYERRPAPMHGRKNIRGPYEAILAARRRALLASVGMTYLDMANYFLHIGAHWAINLDGGGSSTLVPWDFDANRPVTINVPSDGNQRYVPTGSACSCGSRRVGAGGGGAGAPASGPPAAAAPQAASRTREGSTRTIPHGRA